MDGGRVSPILPIKIALLACPDLGPFSVWGETVGLGAEDCRVFLLPLPRRRTLDRAHHYSTTVHYH